MRKKSIQTLITGVNTKGFGIGEYEGKRIAVPFTMPGDRVRAFVLRKKAGFYLSMLEEILEPSKARIEAKCVHFGSCGGCMWQHIPYSQQLIQKEGIVSRLYSDICDVSPTMPSDLQWNYRNKMEFSFSQDSKGNRYIGLIKQGSRGKVFNMKECHLVNNWFVEATHVVKRWWESRQLDAYHPHRNSGSLRSLTVREGVKTGDRLIMLTVSGVPEYALSKGDIESFTAAVKDSLKPERGNLQIFLRIHQAIKGQPTQFYEMKLFGPEWLTEKLSIFGKELHFNISPAAFFQPNTYQAEKIYTQAIELASLNQDQVVYDLYCGTGTLGICAAQKVKEVIGIELLREAVIDAQENIKANGIVNMKVLEGDVRKVLAQDLPKPDAILLDPPRAGLDPMALQHVLACNVPCIVYISCNPKTQCENVREMMKGGYRVRCVQPVDQFPHTPHLENIVVLRK